MFEAVAVLGVGALAGFALFAAGWLTRDRESCAGCEVRDRAIARADACLARAQAELETGDGLAEADDFAAWSRELREEAS